MSSTSFTSSSIDQSYRVDSSWSFEIGSLIILLCSSWIHLMYSKDTLRDNAQFLSVWNCSYICYMLSSGGIRSYLFHGRCLINFALAYCFVTGYAGCPPEPPTWCGIIYILLELLFWRLSIDKVINHKSKWVFIFWYFVTKVSECVSCNLIMLSSCM